MRYWLSLATWIHVCHEREKKTTLMQKKNKKKNKQIKRQNTFIRFVHDFPFWECHLKRNAKVMLKTLIKYNLSEAASLTWLKFQRNGWSRKYINYIAEESNTFNLKGGSKDGVLWPRKLFIFVVFGSARLWCRKHFSLMMFCPNSFYQEVCQSKGILPITKSDMLQF